MFILTGESGEYAEDIVRGILAVSESEDKLILYRDALIFVRRKLNKRDEIVNQYKNANQYRVKAVPQQPNLSKDHLAITDGKARCEINRKNVEIDQQNYADRLVVHRQIDEEARSLAESSIPLNEVEEQLIRGGGFERYTIEEIKVIC